MIPTALEVVLCNCDDPRQSEFFKYFAEKFEKLKLKRLIAVCYKSQDVDLFSQGDCERAIKQVYEGDKNGNMAFSTNSYSAEGPMRTIPIIFSCSQHGREHHAAAILLQ